ncbi:ferrous iron transport protein B [Caproiciproducens sp. NJN-50]|uniref:ferrous iron transport protein B n=1 Tax=Acutalibacteraceae TaxID=3082771 RepID=UPI000FFE202F|nr:MULTISPECIES: ferrous iron transport protein B [Acutalibacteraceae]QAT50587.1 ferrous iron transport protein B [Caproiciproducens sp. NJN-50]
MERTLRSAPVWALAGNPNCGKTTLFNRLTGSSATVGNWPGVTVEKKSGTAKWDSGSAHIVDLPGIYSLVPYTPEEALAGNFLREEKPDLILNVIDATCLERSLYLTTQLLELGIPVVAALSMTDALARRGGKVNCRLLSVLLGVPVVPICATRGTGTAALLKTAARTPDGPVRAARPIRPAPGVRDPDLESAQARYRRIHDIVSKTVSGAEVVHRVTERIDRIATDRYLSIPLFLLIVLAVFALTFGTVGNALVQVMGLLVDSASRTLGTFLEAAGVSFWVKDLILNGILAGVGAVLKFLPQIALLFLLLSFLEDSGYMARAAFIMDAPMRKIGLSGRSFVPLLMGFGCTVPAVMGTRILESEKDRRLTVLITPFMSCSAKMPVYSLFLGVFFAGRQPAAMFLIYLLGVLMGLLSAVFLKSTVLRGEPAPFLMELPDYRLPTPGNIRKHVGRRVRDFLRRAGTTVFLATVAIWLLQSISVDFHMTLDSSRSLLALAGHAVAPVFTLCGFGGWKQAVALLTGLVAKESIVGAYGVLCAGDPAAGLKVLFSPASACSYLIFILLYTPCSAALAAIRRESGLRLAVFSAFYQFATAWYASALFYQLALLFQRLHP